MRLSSCPAVVRTSSVAIAFCLAAPTFANDRPSAIATTADTRRVDVRSGPTELVTQDASPTNVAGQDAASNEEITVTGWRVRELDKATSTSSRLGLSIRETPATIDQIGADEILTRGFRTVEEATVSLPGVISGGSPGD